MNREDYIPLRDAIEGGDVAAVESFLQTPGVDVDFMDVNRFTHLNCAIIKNHKAIVEVLLAHGAAVNGPAGADKTPLQEACEPYSANEDIVKLLIDHGADVDAMTIYRRETPLTNACHWSTNFSIARLLINAGADVDGGDGIVAPLHWVAIKVNTEAIELLIQAGADVHRVSTNDYADVRAGSTPLHYATSVGQLGSLTILPAAGADPHIADAAGQTPLYPCSSVEFVTALLDAGCDPLHQDNRGRTPLQFLCEGPLLPFFTYHFNIITNLVAAGDRSWQCVPTPCPGLEAAMLSVWQAAPDELPELVKRMENPPQTLIELYAHMDDDDDDDDEEMKKVVQEVLRVLHHHFAGFPHLKEHLLNSIFGFETSV